MAKFGGPNVSDEDIAIELLKYKNDTKFLQGDHA